MSESLQQPNPDRNAEAQEERAWQLAWQEGSSVFDITKYPEEGTPENPSQQEVRLLRRLRDLIEEGKEDELGEISNNVNKIMTLREKRNAKIIY